MEHAGDLGDQITDLWRLVLELNRFLLQVRPVAVMGDVVRLLHLADLKVAVYLVDDFARGLLLRRVAFLALLSIACSHCLDILACGLGLY